MDQNEDMAPNQQKIAPEPASGSALEPAAGKPAIQQWVQAPGTVPAGVSPGMEFL